MNAVPILVGFVLALTLADASAQAIYRCGNEYTRVPCKDARSVDADGRSAAQVDEARAVAARERRLGNDMARDRRAQDASMRPTRASSLSPAPAPAPVDAPSAASATLKPKKKAKAKIRVVDEKDFVATEPKPPKPR
jgi:sRNA-binding protein